MPEPDKWTNAWWREQFHELLKGYRGASHGINRCLSDYEDTWTAVVELRERCETLEKERDEANSKLGEMSERLERMAKWLDGLKKNGSSLTSSDETV